MAHFEFSPVLRDTGLVLTKEEVKILVPSIKRSLKAESAYVDYYQDILEGGEATERQQNCLVKHQEKAETLEQILSTIELKR